MEELIAAGHPPAVVWDYTPRQISGFLKFASARKRKEAAFDLGLQSMAARGDPADLKKKIKELEKD